MVGPGSAHRSEHVTAHDPGAEILERAYREVVVDAGRPAVSLQDLPLEGAGGKEPLVQSFDAAAERLVTALLLRSKLDRVYEDRLSDAIPEELWNSKSAALQDELRQV